MTDFDKIHIYAITDALLLSESIPTHVKGYIYLRETIAYIAMSPYIRLCHVPLYVTYTYIARDFSTTPIAIEKAVRYALRAGKNMMYPKNAIYTFAMTVWNTFITSEIHRSSSYQPADGGTE